jgi:hypothetical protein
MDACLSVCRCLPSRWLVVPYLISEHNYLKTAFRSGLSCVLVWQVRPVSLGIDAWPYHCRAGLRSVPPLRRSHALGTRESPRGMGVPHLISRANMTFCE